MSKLTFFYLFDGIFKRESLVLINFCFQLVGRYELVNNSKCVKKLTRPPMVSCEEGRFSRYSGGGRGGEIVW